jgi:hypothetical protein
VGGAPPPNSLLVLICLNASALQCFQKTYFGVFSAEGAENPEIGFIPRIADFS